MPFYGVVDRKTSAPWGSRKFSKREKSMPFLIASSHGQSVVAEFSAEEAEGYAKIGCVVFPSKEEAQAALDAMLAPLRAHVQPTSTYRSRQERLDDRDNKDPRW